jgi:hypothetical protein
MSTGSGWTLLDNLRSSATPLTLTQSLSLREREFLFIPHPASCIPHLVSRIPHPVFGLAGNLNRAIFFFDL